MSKKQKRLLLAEDLSAVGNISLGVASPILQAKDIPVALLPTSLLSSQSEGFAKPAVVELGNWIQDAFKHWESADIAINSALIGYFDQVEVGIALKEFFQKHSLDLVVLDPAFADEGELYPRMTLDHVKNMRELLSFAHVTTPNVTEAYYLTDSEFVLNDRQSLKTLLEKMEALMQPGGRAIITGVTVGEQLGCALLEDGKVKKTLFPTVPGHFYGSGDVFSALLTVFLWEGYPLDKAVKEATEVTYIGLKQTSQSSDERRFGIKLSGIIKHLLDNH
ncbi:PfkB family carbohydrate kinase [Ligilactobacillus ceti]|uniref:pyridoxal kinase n=1 Tax=Ligilactobacillus ceti DSM 22408 TaxID=1122146 RepID=A0A0R2KIC1_9LACO|nr:PfkB family carbohydrate kinase [Ligilactobacillus ceti]KRN89123.1 phosphomethylpyrimidine kinase [Ligilactobacillus ceti DSM 22408]